MLRPLSQSGGLSSLPTLLRRNAIGLSAGLLGAAAVASTVFDQDALAADPDLTTETTNPVPSQISPDLPWTQQAVATAESAYAKYRTYFPAGSLAATTVQGFAFLGMQLSFVSILSRLGLQKVGNADASKIKRDLIQKPVQEFMIAAVIAPVLEECLFRALPGVISTSWPMGLASTLLFAMIHNFKTNDRGKIGYDYRNVPLMQILGGLYFWNIYSHYGLGMAIYAHSLHNGVAMGISLAIFLSHSNYRARI
jgi:membrane protease YdiL (CAAX protease family)